MTNGEKKSPGKPNPSTFIIRYSTFDLSCGLVLFGSGDAGVGE